MQGYVGSVLVYRFTRTDTQQCSTAKQRFVKNGVHRLFPLCTGTPGHNHKVGHTRGHLNTRVDGVKQKASSIYNPRTARRSPERPTEAF